MTESLFKLPALQAQPAPPLPAQPQVGNQPVPGQTVATTGTGTPSGPVAFGRGQPVGFFTDTTLCIGCKACEVACKEWNQLPAELGANGQALPMTGLSYDNTAKLSGTMTPCSLTNAFNTVTPARTRKHSCINSCACWS